MERLREVLWTVANYALVGVLYVGGAVLLFAFLFAPLQTISFLIHLPFLVFRVALIGWFVVVWIALLVATPVIVWGVVRQRPRSALSIRLLWAVVMAWVLVIFCIVFLRP